MPPEVVAPEPVSLLGIVIVIVEAVGTVVTINFLSQKSEAPKLELVIELNVEVPPKRIISPFEKPWSDAKVIVTAESPFVVLKALEIAVPDGLTKGWMS